MNRETPSQDLDHAQLVDLIRRLEQDFDWDDSLRGVEPSDRWESRTASLYVLGHAGHSVVLKAGRGWSAEKAGEVHYDLVSLETLLGSRPDLRVNVPHVLGWASSPPAVCQTRVYGDDLGKVIGSRDGYMRHDLDDVMSRLGSALGLFHTSNVTAVSDLTPDREADLRGDLLKMASRLRVDPGVVSPDEVVISRKYGDFYPHNQLIADDGFLWVLDQPSSHTVSPVHRDVAYYVDRLSTHVGRYEHGGREEVASATARLQEAFLAGYRETGPSQLSSPRDRNLILVYRSYKGLSAAFKRLRQRRYREILANLRLMVHWRRQVGDNGRASPTAG